MLGPMVGPALGLLAMRSIVDNSCITDGTAVLTTQYGQRPTTGGSGTDRRGLRAELQVPLAAVVAQCLEYDVAIVGFQSRQQSLVPAQALARSDQTRFQPQVDGHRPLQLHQDRLHRQV